MKKFVVIAALFASCTYGARIPLSKRAISKATYMSYKESVESRSTIVSNGLGQVIPLKDYMNTQYFAEVQVGTPA